MEQSKLELSQDVKENQDMTLKVIRYQMNLLPNYINKVVKCIYWELGLRKEVEGVLNSVTPYDKVGIGNDIICFVGCNDAIEQISTNEVIIYTCSGAIGYEGCFAYDHFALVGAQQTILGRSVKYEDLKEIVAREAMEKAKKVSEESLEDNENKSR